MDLANEQYALDLLCRARHEMHMVRDAAKRGTRELSIAITECDTAILWLQHDMKLKTPVFPQTGDRDGGIGR